MASCSTRWLALIRGLRRRNEIAREVDEEVEFHLHQEAERYRALGATLEEARRLAAVAFGGPAAVRTEVADVRTTRVEVIWRELRFGVRTLAAARAFTIPAVIVLALGISGTTIIFSVIDGVLLSPLRFNDPDPLVRVWSRNDDRQIPFLSVSPADFEDWRARTTPSLELAAYERPRITPSDAELSEPLSVMPVSPELFPLLGIQPALGRIFASNETRAPVAIVSDGLWRRQIGGTLDAIGRVIVVEQRPLTIVGVMPRHFEVPNARADVWMPLDTTVPAPARFAHVLRVLARPRRAARGRHGAARPRRRRRATGRGAARAERGLARRRPAAVRHHRQPRVATLAMAHGGRGLAGPADGHDERGGPPSGESHHPRAGTGGPRRARGLSRQPRAAAATRMRRPRGPRRDCRADRRQLGDRSASRGRWRFGPLGSTR